MGLMDRIRSEFVDIVEWVDDNHHAIVWRFPVLISQMSETAIPMPARTEAQVSLILKGVEYTGSLPVIVTSFSEGISLLRMSITSLNDLCNSRPSFFVLDCSY